MYCPKCGKQTPDTGKFCMNCGAALNIEASVPIAWEYKDFIFTWEKGKRLSRALASSFTRDQIWSAMQIRVLVELQTWFDAGWEPITETGVGACQWGFFSKHDFRPSFIEVIWFFWTISLYFWIWLFVRITNPIQYEELIGYRVKMRRPQAST